MGRWAHSGVNPLKNGGESTVEQGVDTMAISAELGMRPLMERVLSRRAILRA